MDEHPRRCLINALGSRHEGDTCIDEGFVNLHIVGAVACEAVELMHDAELHPRRRNERQHLLQPVTIRRACGLARVHELADNPRSEFVGLALVRPTLGGNREAFLGAAAFGLLPRGHSQV
ncbi:hypothetical protein FAM23867_001073 [Propionibacterium freudenreichii]|nr:hypothetical protein [Propionibacterium freudenreichii]MDK9345879.1 hypothetical protein [Propionibacterium freudenreichii]